MIIDQKSRIWLGGNSGLWYYDGNDFTQVSDEFIGYMYEDTRGDIWTSSRSGSRWALSKYSDLSDPKNPVVEIIKADEGMFFGIFEDNQTNGKSPAINKNWCSAAETFGGDVQKQYETGNYAEVWFKNASIKISDNAISNEGYFIKND